MGDEEALRDRIGLSRFLDTYPGMRVHPSPKREVRFQGEFAFTADHEEGPIIEDAYDLIITVSEWYPDDLPVIEETGGRIPRDLDHHVFPDRSLCLGSPLRLHDIALSTPELTDYAKKALVPYLYAISYWEDTGERFLFGELDHNAEGVLADFGQVLGLDDPDRIGKALHLLAMKKRKANKHPCPCGCGDRLGVCDFNETIRELRDHHGRPFFKRLVQED